MKTKMIMAASAVALSITFAGCQQQTGPSPEAGTKAPQRQAAQDLTAHTMAEKLAADIPGSVVHAVDEDNDANKLIGRPNGYDAASVIQIKGLDSDEACDVDEPGVDCGVTVEEWSNTGEAERRARYIADLQAESPALGKEWHEVRDGLLLRVSGEMKPSQAKKIREAFNS